MRVASLHIYPVKSMRAVDVDRADMELRGLAHDRRWMITDDEGKFLTQRASPALARIVAAPFENGLRLSAGGAALDVLAPTNDQRTTVTIWNDEVSAIDAGEAVAELLSGALDHPARLFFMDGEAARTTSGRWGPKRPVSFADAYPLLVTTTASLNALNDAIIENGRDAVTMGRFRPNIVIDGADPWAEDFWKVIRVGDIEIDLVKPCDRCLVTTLDQETGQKQGREPLKTLGKIRRSAHPDLPDVTLFGWNAAPRSEGVIKAGDEVKIVEARPEGWPLT